MKKIIFMLIVFTFSISSLIAQTQYFETTHVYIVTNDPIEKQYIVFLPDGECKLTKNQCQGFMQEKDRYSINDDVITFKSSKLILKILSSTKLEIVEEAGFTCFNLQNGAVLDKMEDSFYSPTVKKLRIRKYSDNFRGSREFIRFLEKDEKIFVIRQLEQEDIDGIAGHWVLIETLKGERAVCYDGYLKKVK